MASVRVATWNLNNRGRRAAEQLGGLARKHGIDLLLLQELNTAASKVLVEAAGLDWIVTAFDAGAPAAGGRGRRRTAAIAGRGSAPRDAGILPGLHLQERAVWATVATPVGDLSCVAYHAPPGVSWGSVKVSQAHALLRWVSGAQEPIVVGADANTPEVDHPERDLVRTHWHTGRRRVGEGPGMTSSSAGARSTDSMTPSDAGWKDTRQSWRRSERPGPRAPWRSPTTRANGGPRTVRHGVSMRSGSVPTSRWSPSSTTTTRRWRPEPITHWC